MATKSALLEYILSSAMELVEAKGAKLLNANYFITQLLHTINEYRAGRFPDELNTEENRLELASAVTILEGYHFDFEEKEEELRSFIMSDKYKHSDMEAFIFKKIDYSDKLVSDDVVRQTSFYLEKVLAEPTTMIEDNIIALSGGSVSAEELDKMVDVLKEVYQEGTFPDLGE